MRFELKDFQVGAVKELYDVMRASCEGYYEHSTGTRRHPASCSLCAPTGSGKTIISGAVIEGLLQGNDELELVPDERAAFLWVSDSPSLNRQTMLKFQDATELGVLSMEEMGPDFTQWHTRLEAGHVYFLNRQLLASGNTLVRGGETLTFWQLLRDTIDDPSTHLYMMLDEAHRGLGSNRSARGAETIYGKIIDGEDGSTPVPVVVGISATPKRFNEAMARARARTVQPPVVVSPKDVQESGLLKDKIVISVPTNGGAVESLYTRAACDALNDSTMLWAGWCAQNDVEAVVPLLVIQVPNSVEASTLASLCLQVSDYVKGLDPHASFAHVFGDVGLVNAGSFEIPRVEPEDVQRRTDIRVLFAKEAISTGWDCPRAEVIYSMRRHTDDQYVAQLIGRMVRTPLAQKVSVDKLNAVTCYLPSFDPKAVGKVVDYLTKEGSDDYSGISPDPGSVIVTPVNVEWDEALDDRDSYTPSDEGGLDTPTTRTAPAAAAAATVVTPSEAGDAAPGVPFSEGSPGAPQPPLAQLRTGDVEVRASMPQSVRDAFVSVCSRVRAESNATNWILGATTYAGLLSRHGIDTTEVNAMDAALAREIGDGISIHRERFEEARRSLVHVSTTRVELRYLAPDSVRTNESTEDADDYTIRNARRMADRTFTKLVAEEYFRSVYKPGADIRAINADLAAAASVPGVRGGGGGRGRSRAQTPMKGEGSAVAQCDELGRADFEQQMNTFGIPHTVYLRAPTKDIQNLEYEGFPKHVVNDPETHLAYVKLEDYEKDVLRTELARPYVRAWYRNPPHGLPEHTLSVVYRFEGSRRAMHPDFIMFDDVAGGVMPSIVDPHGTWLPDALGKLKGMCAHANEFGKSYARIWSIDRVDGRYMYLDLKDQATNGHILGDDAESAAECYRRYGRPYGTV